MSVRSRLSRLEGQRRSPPGRCTCGIVTELRDEGDDRPPPLCPRCGAPGVVAHVRERVAR